MQEKKRKFFLNSPFHFVDVVVVVDDEVLGMVHLIIYQLDKDYYHVDVVDVVDVVVVRNFDDVHYYNFDNLHVAQDISKKRPKKSCSSAFWKKDFDEHTS